MFLRLLLFLIVFYLVYYLLRQLLVKPFREGYREQDPGKRYQQHKRRQEGSVTISYNPRENSSSSHQEGEYVDYEEVEDEDEETGSSEAGNKD